MNYYSNKSQNKTKALNLIEFIESNYKDTVINQVNKSVIYDEDFQAEEYACINSPIIKVVDALTLDVLDNIDQNGNIGVLNFASYKNPGGRFLDGSYAQEEYLCHNTTLYSILSNSKFDEYFGYNRVNLNKGLYSNRAIFSPEVTVIDKGIDVSILTCASPNKAYMLRSNKITEEQNYNAVYSRIKFVLDIFQCNNIDTLILGAFGCGVFKQDPNDVAQIFKELIPNYNFKQVLFTIPDKESNNFKVFKEILV